MPKSPREDVNSTVARLGQSALDSDLLPIKERKTRPRSAGTMPTQRAKTAPQVPVFPGCGWVKVYREWPPELRPSWGLLSWQARGMYWGLFLACDRQGDGVLPLGEVGLMGVCAFLSAPKDQWPAVQPYLTELIDGRWLEHDEGRKLLAVAWYRPSQDARSSGARRQHEYRQRERAEERRR